MTWRSLLYVPATSDRFLEKAQTRGADALILDLEDSVPQAEKRAARARLLHHWPRLATGPAEVIVRINAPLLEAAEDLAAVVRPGLRALYISKVRGPEMLAWLDEAVATLEDERGLLPGTIGFVPLIEDPHALEAAFAVAAAPRVIALSLGSEDFATACGMTPTPDHLLPARARIVQAAAAAGIAPLGLLDSAARLAVTPDLVQRSRAFGFTGAAVVHPDLVEALNHGFAPTRDEIEWATAVQTAMAGASATGAGAARLDGRMIDRPVAARAAAILRRQSPPARRDT